jgi:hypothetical protein
MSDREAMSESTCRLLIASERGIILASVELLIKNWNEFGEIAKTSLSSLAAVAAKSPPDIILIPIRDGLVHADHQARSCRPSAADRRSGGCPSDVAAYSQEAQAKARRSPCGL